jgi:hypothetical protein
VNRGIEKCIRNSKEKQQYPASLSRYEYNLAVIEGEGRVIHALHSLMQLLHDVLLPSLGFPSLCDMCIGIPTIKKGRSGRKGNRRKGID